MPMWSRLGNEENAQSDVLPTEHIEVSKYFLNISNAFDPLDFAFHKATCAVAWPRAGSMAAQQPALSRLLT